MKVQTSNAITITPPPLLDWQKGVYRSQARFKVVDIGRRAGKTTYGEYCAVRQGCIPNSLTWWIAPQYSQAMIGWKGIKRLASQIPGVKFRESEYIATFPGGGIVQCRSGDDPDALKGEGLDLAILDEAALLKLQVWNESIRPALSDKRGRALFLSTPKGVGNWFFQIYGYGLDPLYPDWESWQLPSTVNPLMTPEELEIARATLPDRLFRQEYLAEFIENSGAVFRNVDAVCTGAMLSRGDVSRRYVAGVDWGKDNDFTVISVWDVEARREVYIERFNKINWSYQRSRLSDIYQRFHLSQVWAESNSIGGPNIEALQGEGINVIPFNTTAQTKGPAIEYLALSIEKPDITLTSDPVAAAELKAYEIDRAPSGVYRYGAPVGLHDDTVMSRAIGLHGVRSGGAVEIFSFGR